MRIASVLVLLCWYCVPSLAFGERGAAERAYYYLIYLAEEAFDDPSKRNIAVGCVGTRGGRCTFRQFCDYIWAPRDGHGPEDLPADQRDRRPDMTKPLQWPHSADKSDPKPGKPRDDIDNDPSRAYDLDNLPEDKLNAFKLTHGLMEAHEILAPGKDSVGYGGKIIPGKPTLDKQFGHVKYGYVGGEDGSKLLRGPDGSKSYFERMPIIAKIAKSVKVQCLDQGKVAKFGHFADKLEDASLLLVDLREKDADSYPIKPANKRPDKAKINCIAQWAWEDAGETDYRTKDKWNVETRKRSPLSSAANKRAENRFREWEVFDREATIKSWSRNNKISEELAKSRFDKALSVFNAGGKPGTDKNGHPTDPPEKKVMEDHAKAFKVAYINAETVWGRAICPK